MDFDKLLRTRTAIRAAADGFYPAIRIMTVATYEAVKGDVEIAVHMAIHPVVTHAADAATDHAVFDSKRAYGRMRTVDDA